MSEVCELLDWDSQFWGFRVGRVIGSTLTPETLQLVDDWCRAERVRCLYFLADPADYTTTSLAEASAFHLADVRVTYNRLARAADGESAGIRLARSSDIPALRAIASRSYRDSRFYFDRCFPRALADELYATWVEKSCAGWADAVLVVEADGVPGAYVTCVRAANSGVIGLVGVSEALRGRGIGGLLVTAALGWFSQNGIDHVSVVTQARNVGAQRLYQRAGFVLEDVGLWFHRWHDAKGDPLKVC